MTLRLRQVALAAGNLDRAVADLTAVFGLGVPFNDPGVGLFGLRNAVFAIGDTFLEVVSPVRDDASAARFIARKGGDAGYMVIVQTDDLARERRRLGALGVRIVFETAVEDIATIHLHPHDVGGAIVSIDEARPARSWRWGGPEWERRSSSALVREIVGAEIACVDPVRTALRWAEVLGREAPTAAAGAMLPLDSGRLSFTSCVNASGEGLVRVTLNAPAPDVIVRRAADRGLALAEDQVFVCGTWFRLAS